MNDTAAPVARKGEVARRSGAARGGAATRAAATGVELPGVDVRPRLALALPPPRPAVVEQHRDPAPRIGRVDHIADLAVCGHVQATAALVGDRHERLEQALALIRITDSIELAAHAPARGAPQ